MKDNKDKLGWDADIHSDESPEEHLIKNTDFKSSLFKKKKTLMTRADFMANI